MAEKKSENKNEQLTQIEVADTIELLTGAEGESQAEVFSEIIEETEPGTIALLLESLPLDERYSRWLQVDRDERVEILSEMRADPRIDLLKQFPDSELDELFSELTPEDLIEWSDSLPERFVIRALAQMGGRQRQHFELYNQYSESEIGRYANHQMLAVPETSTIERAKRFFKRVNLDCNDSIFVFDKNHQYLGTVCKYDLLKGTPTDLITSIIHDDIRAVKANSWLMDAVEAIEHSTQAELAIVDDSNHLIGRITLREATSLVRDHYESQLMASAGLDENDDLFAPIIKSAKQRAVWLGLNLLTAFLASATIGLFENVLAKVVALAVLMPIVASMGGIAGSQTLTLMIRGMALGQISNGNFISLMKNEVGIAIVNGVIWALVVGAVAGTWFNNYLLGSIIGVAILINMAVAALSGVFIPMILQKLNQDAALSGSVILTTVTDVVGFFTFLGLASLLMI